MRAFAQQAGMHPGIVVGRLQHEGLIDRSWMNDLKVSFGVEYRGKRFGDLHFELLRILQRLPVALPNRLPTSRQILRRRLALIGIED
jgi:hypothetical protein